MLDCHCARSLFLRLPLLSSSSSTVSPVLLLRSGTLRKGLPAQWQSNIVICTQDCYALRAIGEDRYYRYLCFYRELNPRFMV